MINSWIVPWSWGVAAIGEATKQALIFRAGTEVLSTLAVQFSALAWEAK